jgi:CRISPR-associated endonuclease/helicase Cas3
MTLSIDDFEMFHRAVHGRAPFGWQSRLLRKVVAEQQWPRVLDLPTGCGKTTCIDIALFALALDATRPAAERWCPRRIAMVVDRRIVVDQAADRGRRLLQALEGARRYQPGALPQLPLGRNTRTLTEAEVDVLLGVSQALATLSDAGSSGEPPLAVFTLRGGIPKDDGWARTPDQPLVIASTVDQIGSRLLIQGYGVSPGMRPVHAGLAGNDTLILLDEVHLSQPFKQTLERLAALRERFARNGLPRRFHFSFLSATPGDVSEDPFRLSREELDPSAPLGPRLHARKLVGLAKVSGRNELAARVAGQALTLSQRHAVVGAVVNRVDTALAVFATLRQRLGEDVVLLTGRMRPLDRDDVLATYRPRIATGERRRGTDEPKLIIVGTQCIEAGADFDFDAMVTESASFDGLRQRFGRVDRLGEYTDQSGNGRAEGVIVHDKEEKDDPIYGETIAATVKWLDAQMDVRTKTVDFGSRSLLDAPSELLAPKANAPTLLPAYLDLWAQTAPAPFEVPEPGLFLHGSRSGPADVQVIWRADLDDVAFDSTNEANIVAAVGAIPPSSLEAVSLPFVVARRWLAREQGVLDGAGDVEIKADDQLRANNRGRLALRWRGEESEVIDMSGIRPGDTLVVPSGYGGIDAASKCFDPEAPNDVADLAERAALLGRGHAALRLHPRVLANLDLTVDPSEPDSARNGISDMAGGFTGWKRAWVEALGKGRRVRAVPWEGASDDGWVVLESPRVTTEWLRNRLRDGAGDHGSLEEGAELTTDDENSVYSGEEVTLDQHARGVEGCARTYARRLGLSAPLVDALSLAAWLHDIGKADPRFQRLLRGGSEIAYLRDETRILAKSAIGIGSVAEHRRAQTLSGYPRGARHEVQSVAMIQAARDRLAERAGDVDMDLVLHLVASHHGHCRPLAPAIEDATPMNVRLARHTSDAFGTLTFEASSSHQLHQLDSHFADRFWSLIGKYGWLELCWLEAILRLADHRASELEARGQP